MHIEREVLSESAEARRYFEEHAISPAVAAKYGVRCDGSFVFYPCPSANCRIPTPPQYGSNGRVECSCRSGATDGARPASRSVGEQSNNQKAPFHEVRVRQPKPRTGTAGDLLRIRNQDDVEGDTNE